MKFPLGLNFKEQSRGGEQEGRSVSFPSVLPFVLPWGVIKLFY